MHGIIIIFICCFIVVVQWLSHVRLFHNPMDCSLPGCLSLRFPRQEFWSGLPFPSPWICLTQSSNLCLLQVSCIAGGFFTAEPPGKDILFQTLVKVTLLSPVRLFATRWTGAHQAPLSMGFSRQEYWSGLPFPSPRDLPDPGNEPRSPALQADALPSEPLLLLLSHFSRVRLCATPQTAAHQAPSSLGFSWQGHWSGLPFPSPMHESEM